VWPADEPHELDPWLTKPREDPKMRPRVLVLNFANDVDRRDRGQTRKLIAAIARHPLHGFETAARRSSSTRWRGTST